MKKIASIFLIAITSTILMACSSISDKTIKADFEEYITERKYNGNHESWILNEFEIVDRKSEHNNQIIYTSETIKDDLVEQLSYYCMNYSKYDSGWKIDSISPYNESNWKLKILRGVNKSEIIDFLTYQTLLYGREQITLEEYPVSSIEITQQEPDLDNGNDTVTFSFDVSNDFYTLTINAVAKYNFDYSSHAWTAKSFDYEIVSENFIDDVSPDFTESNLKTLLEGKELKLGVAKVTISSNDISNIEVGENIVSFVSDTAYTNIEYSISYDLYTAIINARLSSQYSKIDNTWSYNIDDTEINSIQLNLIGTYEGKYTTSSLGKNYETELKMIISEKNDDDTYKCTIFADAEQYEGIMKFESDLKFRIDKQDKYFDFTHSIGLGFNLYGAILPDSICSTHTNENYVLQRAE